MLVVNLPSIGRNNVFLCRNYLIKCFNQEIILLGAILSELKTVEG